MTTASQGRDDDAFGLAMFLLTSARGCLDEPSVYGPLRLLQALSRLATISRNDANIRKDDFLVSARRKLEKNQHLALQSEEEFTRFLDSLIKEFTAELKRRNATD